MNIYDVEIGNVIVTLNGIQYPLTYNPQTDYFEAELTAPEITGLHNISVEYRNSGELAIENVDLVVLLKEQTKLDSHEIIGYFLDQKTFEINDVSQLNVNEINQDLETNGNSIFISPKKLNIEEEDYIFLKIDEEISFLGIIEKISDENGQGRYNLSCKDILSMFDFQVFDENSALIKEAGIEDFIADVIKREFIENTDSFFNKPFFEIEVLSHTKKNISISNLVTVTNDVYNFLTFLNNAIENYELSFDFFVNRNKLLLKISTRENEKLLVDATTSDISNYQETFSLKIVAKVEVLVKENNTKYYRYLLNDRTTTTDANNPNRVYGKVERVSVESEEDAEETAINKFKSNSYNHNITFVINKNSLLHNVSKMKLGTPIQIKTKENVIHDTYISKIKRSTTDFVEITCGNLRVGYIDKFLQERRKNLW